MHRAGRQQVELLRVRAASVERVEQPDHGGNLREQIGQLFRREGILDESEEEEDLRPVVGLLGFGADVVPLLLTERVLDHRQHELLLAVEVLVQLGADLLQVDRQLLRGRLRGRCTPARAQGIGRVQQLGDLERDGDASGRRAARRRDAASRASPRSCRPRDGGGGAGRRSRAAHSARRARRAADRRRPCRGPRAASPHRGGETRCGSDRGPRRRSRLLRRRAA